MTEHKLCFFYGTLRKGECNSEWCLPNSELVSEDAVIIDQQFILSGYGRVPFACPDPDGDVLKGEVWKCPPEDFEQVQNLELGAGYEQRMYSAQDVDTLIVYGVETFVIDYISEDNRVLGDTVSWPRFGD